jgi:hypothetical protein
MALLRATDQLIKAKTRVALGYMWTKAGPKAPKPQIKTL